MRSSNILSDYTSNTINQPYYRPSVLFNCSTILEFEDLITYKRIITPYKADNRSLEGCVQVFFKPTAAVHNGTLHY